MDEGGGGGGGGGVTTRQPAKNLWISGAPISYSHVSYIKTHFCIIFLHIKIFI